MSESVSEDLLPWVSGMPDEMVIQIQENVTKLLSTLPETPEALEAAYQTARFNLLIAKGFAEQIGGPSVDDNDSIWRIVASMVVQNMALMMRINEITDQPNQQRREQ